MTSEGMSGEPAASREMRILADILALTLDDQPGAAESALANVRHRAREGGVTAGALKDAWRRLQAATPRLGEPAAPQRADGTVTALTRTRMELAELQSQVAHAEHLQRQDLLRYGLMLRRARLLATLAGVLAGGALTALLFELVLVHG